VPLRRVFDLVEPSAHTLAEVVQAFRSWLGLAPARVWPVPRALAQVLAKLADALGWLGWRSPLRSTALAELEAGVVGDPQAWHRATGQYCASLQDTLHRMPSTVQELWFARTYLMKPMLVAGLALFWLQSGLVAWAQLDNAAGVLAHSGLSSAWSRAAVHGGIVVDMLLGLAVLWRPWTRHAALGMVAVTALYLAGASVLTPALWVDPLGPLVKGIPGLLSAAMLVVLSNPRR
jgi:hypothetical protein